MPTPPGKGRCGTTWQIEVVAWKPLPSAAKLAQVGVPPRVVSAYQMIRHEMTRGLKRRVKEDVN